ncbi:ADP-ribosyltransferase, partial [Kitasatospora sp. NPDC004240]
QLKADISDGLSAAPVALLHFEGGVLQAGTDMMKLGRSLNPYDPYNISHPHKYVETVNTTLAGLITAGDHPVELVKGIVGSGWGSDPAEAGGKLVGNLIGGGGGGGTAAKTAATAAAKNVAKEAGEQAAKEAAEKAAKEAAEKAAKAAPVPTPTNPAGLPEGWTIKSPATESASAANGAKAAPAPQVPHQTQPAPHHPAPEPVPTPTPAPAHSKPTPGPAPTPHPAPEPAPAPHPKPEPASQPAPHHEPAPAPEPKGTHPTAKPDESPATGHGGEPSATPHSSHGEAPNTPSVDGAPGSSGNPQPDSMPAKDGGTPSGSSGEPALPTVAEQMAAAEAKVAEGIKTFSNDAEAMKYGDDYWNNYATNLPPNEFKSVVDYTGSAYTPINGYLRGEITTASPQVLQWVKDIDSALAARPLPEDVLLRRRTDLHHIAESPLEMPGNVYTEDSYLSTSLGSPAKGFEHKEAVLHLKAPAGTPGLWVEHISACGGMGEREMLLGRGVQWRADDVILGDDGKWHIYGEILPPTKGTTS